jgi:hypothetical protein
VVFEAPGAGRGVIRFLSDFLVVNH